MHEDIWNQPIRKQACSSPENKMGRSPFRTHTTKRLWPRRHPDYPKNQALLEEVGTSHPASGDARLLGGTTVDNPITASIPNCASTLPWITKIRSSGYCMVLPEPNPDLSEPNPSGYCMVLSEPACSSRCTVLSEPKSSDCCMVLSEPNFRCCLASSAPNILLLNRNPLPLKHKSLSPVTT